MNEIKRRPRSVAVLTSSHSTILCPCIALPFPLEGVNAPADEPLTSVDAVVPAVTVSCSTGTRKQMRWHARGYLQEKHRHTQRYRYRREHHY